jgi:Ca2+-binding RTX toxin-like protein
MTATRLEAMTVNGTAAADHLTVDGVHDTVLNGGAGNDMLNGGGFAHNTLVGGAGDDIFTVYTSHDVVAENAGEGTDMVVAYTDFVLPDNVENLRMMTGAEIGVGNALANRITGTSGDDQIQGLGGDDQLQSGDGNDSVEGGDGADTISAGGGADSVTGGTGNDKITGDEGSDSISGGAGADTIEGGAGADTVSGGAGADMFNFRTGDIAKGDTILDFSHADGDKIALNGIDANSVLAGDQKFSFIGTSAFHHVAGELRYEVVNGDANVLGDVNGDGVADFSLHLTHVGSLTSGDFIL